MERGGDGVLGVAEQVRQGGRHQGEEGDGGDGAGDPVGQGPVRLVAGRRARGLHRNPLPNCLEGY